MRGPEARWCCGAKACRSTTWRARLRPSATSCSVRWRRACRMSARASARSTSSSDPEARNKAQNGKARMYIIVTGAAGFIGSNLVRALNARGETDIIAVDNLAHADKFRNLADAEIAD